MTRQSCGNITCWCCYPDLQCHHPERPTQPDLGTVYDCPDCGSTWETVPWNDSPIGERLKARRDHPTRPVVWHRVTAPTRIPGTAP
jgi:hypothetical protein